jgi:L-fucose isomerase-like protein
MPKIGIRPAIDGRRKGVRESLEDQTMAMAKSAAQFLTSNLRHANGLPVVQETLRQFARAGLAVARMRDNMTFVY